MKSKGLRKLLYKCRNVGATVIKYTFWGMCLVEEDYTTPKDVPRGHVAVYVGEDYCKRFVIKISSLKHPLFKALLDRAEEVFDFSAGSKLCIPCNENIFAIILQYITASQRDQRSQLCF
ncbi:hypothetical protein PTKIN_Ptkin16aG0113700 [Pterospermum kingtungense]